MDNMTNKTRVPPSLFMPVLPGLLRVVLPGQVRGGGGEGGLGHLDADPEQLGLWAGRRLGLPVRHVRRGPHLLGCHGLLNPLPHLRPGKRHVFVLPPNNFIGHFRPNFGFIRQGSGFGFRVMTFFKWPVVALEKAHLKMVVISLKPLV